MRLFFVGDLHGDLTAACQAVDAAVEHYADVILQVGDFGIWTHTKMGTEYLNELQDHLDRRSMVLYFVDGNHENFDHLYEIEQTPSGFRMVRDNIVHVPRGKVMEWGGKRIMGFGGANSIDGPNGAPWWHQSRGMYNDRMGNQIDLGNWWWQEEITEAEVDAVPDEPVDVLFTHEAPHGVYIPGINKSYHAGHRQRLLVRKLVDKVKPKLVVHGHYHRRYTSSLEDTKIIGLGDNFGSLNDMLYLVDTEEL